MMFFAVARWYKKKQKQIIKSLIKINLCPRRSIKKLQKQENVKNMRKRKLRNHNKMLCIFFRSCVYSTPCREDEEILGMRRFPELKRIFK